MVVRIQAEALDLNQLHAELGGHEGHSGAIVTFCGRVRDDGQVVALELDHYPAMTLQALQRLEHQACQRWPVQQLLLVHRVGRIELGEPIVWLGVACAHRGEAFAASEYLMDVLKSQVPLWKKVHYHDGHQAWVAAKDADAVKAKRWD